MGRGGRIGTLEDTMAEMRGPKTRIGWWKERNEREGGGGEEEEGVRRTSTKTEGARTQPSHKLV
eukprot:544273-Pleurochrysis_carterae.AAC.6